jgi:hypothetical protein
MEKKYNTVKTIPKSNIRIIEREKIDTTNKIHDRSLSWLGPGTSVKSSDKIDTTNKIHDRSLSWLGTGTSVKSSVAKLVIWAQTLLSNCNWDHS